MCFFCLFVCLYFGIARSLVINLNLQISCHSFPQFFKYLSFSLPHLFLFITVNSLFKQKLLKLIPHFLHPPMIIFLHIFFQLRFPHLVFLTPDNHVKPKAYQQIYACPMGARNSSKPAFSHLYCSSDTATTLTSLRWGHSAYTVFPSNISATCLVPCIAIEILNSKPTLIDQESLPQTFNPLETISEYIYSGWGLWKMCVISKVNAARMVWLLLVSKFQLFSAHINPYSTKPCLDLKPMDSFGIWRIWKLIFFSFFY